MLHYPVRLVETGGGKIRAVFLDVPEAVVEAESKEEALYQAKFALELSLGNYVLHDRPIPCPSAAADLHTIGTDKFSLSEPNEDPEPVGEGASDGRY